jgi:hypothetical protein
MTYIFMAVHYPAPGQLDEVHASMRRMADSAAGTAGLRPRDYFHLESGPLVPGPARPG